MSRMLAAAAALAALVACGDSGEALGPASLGVVKVGMTPDEATKALGAPLTPRSPREDESCWYTHRADTGARQFVDYMVVDGAIVRIDVHTLDIKTDKGVGRGATLEDLQTAYGGTRLTVTPHKYADEPKSHYVKWTDYDPTRGITFEVVNGKVTTFRGGRIPEIDWVEGCS